MSNSLLFNNNCLVRSFIIILILASVTYKFVMIKDKKFFLVEKLELQISDCNSTISNSAEATESLKLKYQYEEKQNLFSFLNKNFTQFGINNLTKRIYLRNPGFWALKYNLQKLPNTYQLSNCSFKCTFLKDIQEKNKTNFSQTLRKKYGINGQFFGDHFHPKDPVPDDLWNIFFTIESPFSLRLYYKGDYSKLNFQREKNILINYWRGADIWWPYFKWIYYDPEIRTKIQNKDYSKGKSQMAVIFVSNCKALKRLEFVRKLGKYMKIDMYGKCGNLTCIRGVKRCDEMLRKDYFFYLAFENSNCRDYITEKLHRSLLNNVVPVVLGAHPDDYHDLAPQGSYIHVEDFSSPQQLAQFLIKISKNSTHYNEYFKWKGTGYTVDKNDKFLEKLCYLCTWFHYMDMEGHKPIRDLTLFQKSENNLQKDLCLKPNQFYWNSNKSLQNLTES